MNEKIMTILVTLIVVILLITISVGIVKGFPNDSGGKESTLIQLCAVWKDEYKCSTEAYMNTAEGLSDATSNLAALCERFYDSAGETDGVNNHCKKMCAENNCNPMIIDDGGET